MIRRAVIGYQEKILEIRFESYSFGIVGQQ